MKEFNFKLEPGRKLYNNREYVETFPLISVIVPFYNSEKFRKMAYGLFRKSGAKFNRYNKRIRQKNKSIS